MHDGTQVAQRLFRPLVCKLLKMTVQLAQSNQELAVLVGFLALVSGKVPQAVLDLTPGCHQLVLIWLIDDHVELRLQD